MVTLNAKELKEVLNHVIETNKKLQKAGKFPNAVEIKGESGIGKTSIPLEIAKENNIPFVKLNLAQMDELGDLVGYPTKEFKIIGRRKDGENVIDIEKWIDESSISYFVEKGWKLTGDSRMGYAVPEWIQGKDEGGILLLDDWNRADQRFTQATMELIDRQSYVSWTLPKGWTIILTANPDDGNYQVNTQDSAQRTRYFSFNLLFDAALWGEWADKNNVDGRCINFLMMNKELVNRNTNARAITKFFNSISTMDDFSKTENLVMIQLLGESSVGTEFATVFTTFINNRLDKLVTPQEIMELPEDDVKNVLNNAIGTGSQKRSDISGILVFRLINYIGKLVKENKIGKNELLRIKLLLSGTDIIPNDQKYLLINKIYSFSKAKFNKLLIDPAIAKMITQ